MDKDLKLTSRLSRNKDFVPKLVAFIILTIVCAIWALPLVYMFGTSFKPELEIGTMPTNFFPTAGNWTIEHFSGFIIREGKLDNLPIWMINSILIAVISVILTLIVDVLAAYAFVFLKSKFTKKLLTYLLFSMTIPGIIGTTASFTMYASIGNMINAIETRWYTYFWLIMPGIGGVYNMYLMRNYFESVPKDIVDSARMDGASDFRIFAQIMVPLAKSTLLLVTLFVFTGSWNSLLWPQLILGGKDTTFNTLTVAMAGWGSGASWADKGRHMATATFSLIPILIVFIFTQNRMIDGMATTGIKN